MENWKKKAVELVSNLALSYEKMPAVIPYKPQKTKLSGFESKSFKRSTPEHHGVSSQRILELLSALEAEPRANVHSIIILKDYEVISEASREGYSTSTAHLSHSMTKTVIGMAVGLLSDDGLIDVKAPIAPIFPELRPNDERFHSLTIEHLLSMSSGVSFSELGSVTETEWTKAYFESPMSFDAGSEFSYNSMNSYILARICDRILEKERGISLTEFLHARLFEPLGISNYLWEKGPEGTEKGGWGLYMSLESWAKLGALMLNYGVYLGKRILSREWVIESTSKKSNTPVETGDFNYGYQLWVGREDATFLFNGMLGQNVWVCPKNNIIAVLNSGNNELFQQSPALNIIRNYLGGELDGNAPRVKASAAALRAKEKSFFSGRQWIKPKPHLRGLAYFFGLKSSSPFDNAFKVILGEYTFAKNNQGLLPIFIRAMQNNYQGGIESFRFEKYDELLRLTITEGGESYSIDFGFYEYVNGTITPGGEKYAVSAMASATESELGEIEYNLELIFPEMPNTRRIVLTLSEHLSLSVSMTEIPDEKVVDRFLTEMPSMNAKNRFIFDLLERNLGKNFIETKLHELFAPELIAVRTDAPEYADILAEENEKIERKIESSKLIRSLISSFIRTQEDAERPKRLGGTIFSSILGMLFDSGKKADKNSADTENN